MPIKPLRQLWSMGARVSQLALQTRLSHHGDTYKGQNLPFSITSHRLLAIKFAIFLGVPFFVPFYIVRYHLIKASGGKM